MGTDRQPKNERSNFATAELERVQGRIFLGALKKHHADAKLVRQSNPVSTSHSAEERLRKRNQQAGAISTAPICVHATAMGQARQGLKPALHDGMRRRAAQLGDEAHATCIMIRREGEATPRHTTCLT